MDTDLVPMTGGGGLISREARNTVRAINRLKSRAMVRIAEVDASTDVTLAKVDNLTMATGAVASQQRCKSRLTRVPLH